eukprot:Protomagalhaensia_wolfi_Nauph_80__885@NODE_150_length_3412_cov_153_592647_g111_i0_p1_GENE_NODE_150_length_3412_cov_153_592647_g111_i0NODE_150_length_3412_cov_153_592647_g111_i0_p1_ORF_typecomplete_len330_score25_22zfRING_2/PF13639_6/3_8e03zfRING_2/PF13639_6/3_4e16zfrbx1/PF12678_7/1_9e11zfC3HC4_2/PF13923_6/2_3e09zfANAPC11/PF12861_7/5_6e02zfANAPC11/PF12861_7/1_3e07ProkRING_4/PF14447_6/5_3e03ProkRING_4/PF14447_6/4_7e07zfC3HC4/PF00097_25/1_2e06zfC3HC4_3/PF13920_6/1_2e06zfRING_11/PF17123_5/7_2e06zfRI
MEWWGQPRAGRQRPQQSPPLVIPPRPPVHIRYIHMSEPPIGGTTTYPRPTRPAPQRRVPGRCYVCEGRRMLWLEEGTVDPRCCQCNQTFVEIGSDDEDVYDFDSDLFSFESGPLCTLFRTLISPDLPTAALDPPLSVFRTLFNIVNEENLNNILNHIVQNDPNRYGPPPAATQVRLSLPRELLNREAAVGDCAICQESFQQGDLVTQLTPNRDICGHKFHDQCLMPWLEKHNTCPICRFELPTDDLDYEARKAAVRSQLERVAERRPVRGNEPPPHPPSTTVRTSSLMNASEQPPRVVPSPWSPRVQDQHLETARRPTWSWPPRSPSRP